MENDLDLIVAILDPVKDKDKINQLIIDYHPFILNTVSNIKNQYVQAENDEEFSVGLLAFAEAIQRYKKSKGHFLPYARLVIASRVRTYMQNEKNNTYVPLDVLEDTLPDNSDDESDLREEIILLEQELKKFNIDFEDLIEASPIHKDTRNTAANIAEKTSGEKDLVNHLYEKRRLPVTKIAERFFVSVKIIKKSKLFITAVIVIFIKNFSNILDWINKSKKGPKI